MKYVFQCSYCQNTFEVQCPVDQRNTCIMCPADGCMNNAFRVFNPKDVFINTNFNNLPITRYKDLHGFDSTPQHTANYCFHKRDEENQQSFYDAISKKKRPKTIKERMIERYPDTDFSKPFTRTDQQELQTLIEKGPPKPQ